MAGSIQGIYVALFGRPADPAGLAFFNEATNNGANLDAIGDLAKTDEYQSRFANMSNEEIVNSIYQSLFERDGEKAGIDFYVGELEAGRLNINNIAIAILDGAQNDDLTTVNAKIAAADIFTSHLDLNAEVEAYRGNTAAQVGREFLDTVTKDDPGTADEADAAILRLFPDQGQQPGGGGGGGGSSGPQYVNSYGDLSATSENGDLYAGKGNPTDGFAKSVNSSSGIELGLDVRQYQNAAEISPDHDGGTVWTVSPTDQNITRFAYSVSANAGLDNYDFRLSIDTDGSEAKNFIKLDLVKDDVVEAHSFNNSDSLFDWVSTNPAIKIEDDGGDSAGTVSQNVQSLQWYTDPAGRMAGDEHVVKLQAFQKGTNIVLAETEVTIKFSGETDRIKETFSGESNMVLTDGGYGSVELTSDNTAILKDSSEETGPFTKFDHYRIDTPDVVTTSVDINLKSSEISSNEGFNYSVAANKTDGDHLRDFIFHVANDGSGLVVSANNNTNFDPEIFADNAKSIADGWYTFKHTMYENASGDLEVLMEVVNRDSGAVVFHETLTNIADDFAGYGGNRYGWFTNIDVDEGIEVDNWALSAQYFDHNPV